jgi:hypothetical protein
MHYIGHKSLIVFLKSVMPVEASISFFKMATGFLTNFPHHIPQGNNIEGSFCVV